jgi:hypothetical protein
VVVVGVCGRKAIISWAILLLEVEMRIENKFFKNIFRLPKFKLFKKSPSPPPFFFSTRMSKKYNYRILVRRETSEVVTGEIRA